MCIEIAELIESFYRDLQIEWFEAIGRHRSITDAPILQSHRHIKQNICQ